MAVLHVLQYSLPQLQSGYTLRTQGILRAQRLLGLDPLVVTSPRHPSEQEEEVDAIPHYRCPMERGSDSVWLRDRARVQCLAARIEQVARDHGDLRLLHAHSPVLCGLAALRAGRRLGLPVVYEVRGLWEEAMRRPGPVPLWWPRYRLARMMETRVARQARAVVTISEGLRKEFLGRGVPAERLHVVPNGVDTQRFTPRSALPGWREERGLTAGPLLLYLGALRHYEGVDLLLAAFPEIRRGHPEAQLLVAGDGEARPALATEAGERAGIHLLPPVPHEEVQGFYAAADLVVYPRRRDRATDLVTPLKTLEAMAAGKAVIASDVGGLRALLTEGETARFFPAGSVDGLVEACSELLASDSARREMGERARQAAVTRHDWRAIGEQYPALYRSVEAA
jgi:glycogen(starch) synthase